MEERCLFFYFVLLFLELYAFYKWRHSFFLWLCSCVEVVSAIVCLLTLNQLRLPSWDRWALLLHRRWVTSSLRLMLVLVNVLCATLVDSGKSVLLNLLSPPSLSRKALRVLFFWGTRSWCVGASSRFAGPHHPVLVFPSVTCLFRLTSLFWLSSSLTWMSSVSQSWVIPKTESSLLNLQIYRKDLSSVIVKLKVYLCSKRNIYYIAVI